MANRQDRNSFQIAALGRQLLGPHARKDRKRNQS
jgi:hypothetical protein